MNHISPRVTRILEQLAARPEIAEKILRSKTSTSTGEEHPLFAWKPLCKPWQPESNCTFQRDLFYCKAAIIGLSCANGAGKTTTGAMFTASRARGRMPLFSDVRWKVPQTIWVGTEPDSVPKLFERLIAFIPENERRKTHYARGHQYTELKNGSTVRMKSYGQKREEWQMDNLNFAWLDEEPPEHIWVELMARMRMIDSQVLLTFTPVNGTIFMHDVLHIPEKSKFMGKMDGPLALFSASMLDNKTLPPESIQRVIEACRGDEDQIRIRVHGEYINMAGRHIFLEEYLNPLSEKHVCDFRERVWFDDAGHPRVIPAHESSLADGWDIWERPIPRAHYAIGADIASGGLDGDYSAAFIMDTGSGEVVGRYHGKLEPGEFAEELACAGRYYNYALIGWEMNHQGAAVCDRLRQLRYARLYRRDNFGGRVKTELQTLGFHTDASSKRAIIQDLRDALRDKKVIFHDRDTVKELLNFGYIRKELNRAGLYGMAALSGHDDLVMALAITWRVAKKAGTPKMIVEHDRSKTPMQAWLEKQSKPAARPKRGIHRPLLVE